MAASDCLLRAFDHLKGIRVPLNLVRFVILMVSAEGLEPSTSGLKGRCSTTELRTQMVGRAGFEPALYGF